MKVFNINTKFTHTHRVGWNKIVEIISDNINYDINLIDFLDKYFNPWLDKKRNYM